MTTLVIQANTKSAHGSAIIMGSLFLILLIGGLTVALTQDVDWGGPITWFFASLVFGWLFMSFAITSLWLYKLSNFQGPLITINNKGVVHHLDNHNFITWEQIKHIEWNTVNHKGVSATSFRVILLKRNLKHLLLNLFGWPNLSYVEQYLSLPAAEIDEFLLDNAPFGKFKPSQ